MASEAPAAELSFRVGSTFSLPDVVEHLGCSSRAVFARAGVDPALYRHPENRIAARDLGRLFASAAELTGRLDIALLVVRSFRPGSLGLVGEVVADGPDVRTALRNLVRLLPHNTLAGYPVFAESDRIASLRFELRDSDFPGSEFILEGGIAISVRLLKRLAGEAWVPLAVHLGRRKPPEAHSFAAFFEVPVTFSATEDAVFFSADWLDHIVPRELALRDALRPLIAAAPYSELVRRQAAMRLGLASLDAQDIARQLGLSRRQLFRLLKSEGTSCKVLVDEYRFARAKHLLAVGDAPLTEIALALAFSEHSSFTRAFVRWSGTGPEEWRNAHAKSAQ